MSILTQTRDAERAGDLTRRRARHALIAFVVGLPASIWLFARLESLWSSVEPLEGPVFLLAATLLGGALAVAPLGTALAAILGVWFGVESVYLPRTRRTPLIDRLIVTVGLLAWFGPTLALVLASVRAVAIGKIHFSRPPRDYYLATDPIAFWQGVGFWLIVAAALAYPAWRYWRNKLARARRDA